MREILFRGILSPLRGEGRGRPAERFMVVMRAGNGVGATREQLVKFCRLDAPFPLTPALSPGRGRPAERLMVTMRAGNGVGALHEPGSAGVSPAKWGRRTRRRDA